MGYYVEEVSDEESSRNALAEFLAAFVGDGELPRPLEGDEKADIWKKRFSWWWDQNPFCGSDSPRGYILHTEEGEVVGFSGFIPVDYEWKGEVVPSLIATTFFVREAHRHAVMGLISRQRKLGKNFQIIDGSPSEEMRLLLDKLGYQHAGRRFQYYFPLRGFGGLATQSFLERVGLSLSLPGRRDTLASHYLATSMDEVETLPSRGDEVLRRRVTRESIEWLSQVGSGERSFFGCCDAKGELIAYAIGLYKRKYGLCFCLLEDYYDFRPSENGLGQLIRMIIEDPKGSGLARDTDALALSVFAKELRPEKRGIERDTILYYHIPDGIDPESKTCLAIEGDLALI